MARVEFWTTGAGIPRAGWRQAVEAERQGYDGITYVDSQNLSGDPYVAMAIAATQTERILLGTGVTNPFTRHPAVAASAIASVQAESGGRAVLGVGRGDSALAHLGYAPAKVAFFEDYLRRLRGYLRGETVAFEADADVDRLGLADRPTGSRMEWLRPGQPPVPVDVAATGPRVIRAAVRTADWISFAVGASVERLRWAIDVAREEAERCGRDWSEIRLGAYLPVVVHDDPAEAQHLIEGGVALFARFSAMHGEVVGPADEHARGVLEAVHRSYDMRHHAQVGSAQAAVIDPEFAVRFAILGSAAHCIERIAEIAEMGIERLVITGPSIGANRAAATAARDRFVHEVMPAFR